jgi:hypothetical protein
MKYFTLITLCVMFVLPAMAQQQPEVFSPIGLTNGTSFIGRSVVATTFSDTSAPIKIRGYKDVFVVLKTAANDSACVQVYASYSADGVNYGSYALLDSLTFIAETPPSSKAMRISDANHGMYSMKLRVYAAATSRSSINPVTTLTTQIVRFKY